MNPKAVAGRARKAEAAERKAAEAAAKAEEAEAAKWEQGARGKSAADLRNEKAAEKARKKAELQRLAEEDEASTPGKRSNGTDKSAKNKGKSTSKSSSGGGGGSGAKNHHELDDLDMQIAALNATSLDDALDAMELVNARTDKAGRGAAAGSIEKHPERRFKAAFEAYKERELPILKQDHPGLRLQQYNDLLYKQFQKSKENPFNQVHVSFNASKEEKLAVLQAKRDATAERLAA